MCGIVGFTGKKNIRFLRNMLTSIEHRGRDGNAIFYLDGIHLGMNRLAVRDLTKNLYPMKYKQYTLVFNGEIYNYQELKTILTKRHIHLHTHCDAEVLLPLYDMFGLDFLPMLEGMFAISIYDKKKKQVLLARDRFGEKPLYYLSQKGIFGFASEVKALMKMVSKPEISYDSVMKYLSSGYVHGSNTVLTHISKLGPAQYLIYNISDKKVKLGKYWMASIPTPSSQLGDLVRQKESVLINKLDMLIRTSVNQRLLSDVPVGIFISGGVDSSLIGYFAAQKNISLKSFSIRFIGSDVFDESKYSSFVSKHLMTDHTEIECTAKECLPYISEIGKYVDDPVSDPAILPTLLMSNIARKTVKVVLTGEGADELFAGYERYGRQIMAEKVRNQKLLYFIARMTHWILSNRFKNLLSDLPARYHTQNIWSQTDLGQLTGREIPTFSQLYRSDIVGENFRLSMQFSDLEGYLSEQLLMKVDKSTMASTLEARAPYLDSKIAEFAFNLSDEYVIRYGGKYLLKKVAEQYFPKRFVFRKKHGFSVPLKYWFCDELKDVVYSSVNDIGIYAPSINKEFYKQIVDDHVSRRDDNTDKIWSMLVFGSWLKYHQIYY